jgi:hypothetical protein
MVLQPEWISQLRDLLAVRYLSQSLAFLFVGRPGVPCRCPPDSFCCHVLPSASFVAGCASMKLPFELRHVKVVVLSKQEQSIKLASTRRV